MAPYAGKQGSYVFRVGRARRLGSGEPELSEALSRLRGRDEEQAELEADDGRVREDGSQRAELRESASGCALGEERDGSRSARIRIVRRQPRGSREQALGGGATPELPEEVAVTELGLGVRPACGSREHTELRGPAPLYRERHRQDAVRQSRLVGAIAL